MRIHRAVVQLGIAVVFAGTAVAQYAPSAEFKCMQKVAKAQSKFVASKTKCVTKCYASVWKGLFLGTDECEPPYGVSTAACIENAEGKFGAEIRKACDPVFKFGTACPDCYSGGDCGPSGEAGNRVQTIENQLDTLFPGLFCETTPTPFHLEMDCMKKASKGVVKYYTKATKCYDKCYSLVQKGLVASSLCQPPASEPFTVTCLDDARATYVKYIDHDCHPPPAQPDGCGVPYPTAEDWIDIADAIAVGDVSLTYCASPSGAFVE